MKVLLFLVRNVALLSCVIISLSYCNNKENVQRHVILDTDLSSDVDDVGAVAVLHNLASKGKVEILGMMVSSGDPFSVPCLDAINTWYGRPDIPLGMIKGESVRHESKYTQKVAAEFPHNRKGGPDSIDAVRLYRQILAGQDDHSVTVITIGYLSNLHKLLLSAPDDISPLDGKTLVYTKVKELVCMGGGYPEGYEWNFYQDIPATRYVVNNWPTQIIFTGFETGKDIWTGAALKAVAKDNPIRRSYELYNGLTDRPSWDQVAVYYGVERSGKHKLKLWHQLYGQNNVLITGHNNWTAGSEDRSKHSYIVQDGKDDMISNMLEQLMMTIPN